MSKTSQRKGDGGALATGALAGATGGVILGAIISTLLEAFDNGTWMIIMVHATLAMLVMGTWLGPCFTSDEAAGDEV